MKHHFSDIRDAIQTDPFWFDENGTPRYATFHPSMVSDVYASEAVLLLVTCQSCGQEFQVAMSRNSSKLSAGNLTPFADLIKARELHYKDPPNACAQEGCPGSTMNSEPRRVLEYWSKGHAIPWEWQRDTAYEVDVTPDWITAGDGKS